MIMLINQAWLTYQFNENYKMNTRAVTICVCWITGFHFTMIILGIISTIIKCWINNDNRGKIMCHFLFEGSLMKVQISKMSYLFKVIFISL